ncbi:MAG: ABC transporter permease [Candidatus Aenigmatarchaeota archaeon]
MKFSDIIFLALKNLSHRSLRSWLTILGIVIGIATVITMLSIGEGFRKSVTSQLLSVFGHDIIMIFPGTVREGGFASLMRLIANVRSTPIFTDRDINALKNIEEVLLAQGEIITGSIAKFKGETIPITIRGVDTSIWKSFVNVEIGEGRNFYPNEKKSIILGYRAATELFKEKVNVGDYITINDKKFKVIGILKSSGLQMGIIDNVVFMNIEDAREIANLQKNQFHFIQVKVKETKNLEETSKKIEAALLIARKEKEDKKTFTVLSPQQIANAIVEIINSINFFLSTIAAISLLVGSIGISNTMFTAVLERTREIGTLKALGAKNFDILKLFITESVLLGLIGGLIGIFLSFIFVGIINFYGIRSTFSENPQTAIITLDLIFFGILISTLLGAISGYFPARRAAKLEPVEALRYE